MEIILQGKMQSENLLRSECGGYDSDGEGGMVRSSHQYNYNHHYNVRNITNALPWIL